MAKVSQSGNIFLLPSAQLDLEPNAEKFFAQTQANAALPLLALPGEIRNRIWSYVLSGQTFDAASYMKNGDIQPKVCQSQIAHNFTALLRTCRAIYNDTALLPYALNRFCIDKENDKQMLANMLPVQAAAITMLRLTIGSDGPLDPNQRLFGSHSVSPLPGLKEFKISVQKCEQHGGLSVTSVKEWAEGLDTDTINVDPRIVRASCCLTCGSSSTAKGVKKLRRQLLRKAEKIKDRPDGYVWQWDGTLKAEQRTLQH